MTETTERTIAALSDDLFDKYLLPKIALVSILLASLVGTAVSIRLSGQWTAVLIVSKWGYFVTLGVLSGGLLWKHAFVRPVDLETGAEGYCRTMYDRFDGIALRGLVILVPTASIVLTHYLNVLNDGVLVGALGITIAALTIAIGISADRQLPVDAQFRNPLGLLTLSAALLAVVFSAVAEVSLRGGDPVPTFMRVLHLMAFALWIGGAVWNIFVAVPTGQDRPTVAVIRAAGQQLERFRWTVRAIIPILLLTGLYQSMNVLGTQLTIYIQTSIGLAVLWKLGFIGVLVVIFKTCPMWRACSPIDGVCGLQDLSETSKKTVSGDSDA